MADFKKDKSFLVAYDLDRPKSQPGVIVAIYWEDWDSGRPVVEGWHGPKIESEDFARKRLEPYSCQHLMLDIGGYFDCLSGTII
jgi:hypothetical protein